MQRMRQVKTIWPHSILIVAVYLAGHYLLALTANLYWHPPAGWRFLFLLFTPMRLWPWLLLGEWVIYLPDGLDKITGLGGLMTLFTLGRMAGLMAGPWLLRQAAPPLLDDNARSMQRLLGAMAVSALGNALFNTWRPFAETEVLSTLQIFLQLVLGDLNGTLLLTPAGLLLLRRPDRVILRRWGFDLGVVLLPVLLAYAMVILNAPRHVYFFATSMCALPLLYSALRSGWRGVALTFPPVSIAVAIVGITSGNTALATQAQLFLVVVGISSLLLGASVDELNARNRSLKNANAQLDKAAETLRMAAERNLMLSEDLRRWITSELHDELGQSLTALQARLKLAERRTGASEDFAPAWQLIAGMRRSVSGLMADLRPAGLDAFGLSRALHGGAIRELAESAGLAYHVHIEDPDDVLAHLDNNTQTAIYRIVQEAATNAVRHADARNFRIHVRARSVDGRLRIALSVTDDGRGMAAASGQSHKPGIGLHGIRDRVLVLGGRLSIHSDRRGTRLLAGFVVRN